MKRMHVHVGVKNIDEAVSFYSALFGAQPDKQMPDYAKWMLEDPKLNFAISTRSGKEGVEHLGIQVDNEAELSEMRKRISKAELDVIEEGETVCCYAESDKSWVQDPAGIAWEAYHTMGDAKLFSAKDDNSATASCSTVSIPVVTASSCCAPADADSSGCC
jgi:catechol 2,3-dioxygenase-like lactoylglutathione lyase family enzyme